MQKVISFNYVLTDSAGQTLDQSTNTPLSFLSGAGQIIPKLEDEVVGMLIGQKKTVQLKAEDAYGIPDAKMLMDVPKEDLAHLTDLQVGSFLQLHLGEQLKVVRVSKLTDSHVTLDGNHPLAGVDLTFNVELVDSRSATAEEISHGHAHGPGGHQH